MRSSGCREPVTCRTYGFLGLTSCAKHRTRLVEPNECGIRQSDVCRNQLLVNANLPTESSGDLRQPGLKLLRTRNGCNREHVVPGVPGSKPPIVLDRIPRAYWNTTAKPGIPMRAGPRAGELCRHIQDKRDPVTAIFSSTAGAQAILLDTWSYALWLAFGDTLLASGGLPVERSRRWVVRMSGFLLKFDGSPKTLVVTFQASFAGLFGSPVYA